MPVAPEPSDPRQERSISHRAFWARFDLASFCLERAVAQRYRTRIEAVGRDLQIDSAFGRPELVIVADSRPLRNWLCLASRAADVLGLSVGARRHRPVSDVSHRALRSRCAPASVYPYLVT
jgi:hypothetical protein